MDDLTPFEQRIAADLEVLAGPRRPVDARATSRTAAISARSRPWPIVTRRTRWPALEGSGGGRSRTMFGTLRSVAAAVIVAIFGGYLLMNLPQQASVQTPAAASAELVPTGAEEVVAATSVGSDVVQDGRGDIWARADRLRRFSDQDSRLTLVGDWSIADDAAFGMWTMAPAREGGVWLGETTIRRFDGTRFADVIEAPTDGTVRELAASPDGSLWAVVDDGIWRWDGSTWTDTGAEHILGDLGFDGEGRAWVLNATFPEGPDIEGVSTFDGTSWKRYGPGDHPALGGLERAVGETEDNGGGDSGLLAVAPAGDVYVRVNHAILRYDGSTWTDLDFGPSASTLLWMDVAPDGTLWLASQQGVYTWSPGGGFQTVDDNAGGISGISGLVATADGAIVATSDGLHRLADGTSTMIWEVGSQATPTVYRYGGGSVVATESEAWVGDMAGAWRCPVPATADGCRLVSQGLPALSGAPRVALALSPDGTLWSTGPGGTARLDGETWVVIDDTPGFGVTVGPDGTVWVLGPDGLLSAWRDGLTGWSAQQHAALQGIGGLPPWMGVQPDGSVWAHESPYSSTFARFDGETWTKPLGSSIAGRLISDVDGAAIDAGGHVWVLWSRQSEDGSGLIPVFGTARLDGSGWTVVSEAEPGTWLQGLVAAPDGSLWMGSDDGLLRWNGTSWTPAGLGGVFVTPMDVSDDGAVWFTDGASLYRLPADATAP